MSALLIVALVAVLLCIICAGLPCLTAQGYLIVLDFPQCTECSIEDLIVLLEKSLPLFSQ